MHIPIRRYMSQQDIREDDAAIMKWNVNMKGMEGAARRRG